ICEDFSKLFGCADDAKAGDRCLHLLQLLKRKVLVFVEMTQRHIAQGSWNLASLGQELTADAFACKFLRVPEPPLGRLVECCPAYQLATVRRLGRDHLTGLKQALAQDLKAFSPKALTAAIQQLARFQAHNEVMALVKPALEQNDSPW